MTPSSDFATLYQELILDHAGAGEGRGETTGFQPQSHQVNPTCGDEITLGVRLIGDRIDEVRWHGHGCAISQASASLLTGLVAGSSIAEARELLARFREVMRSRGTLELDEATFGDAVALNGVSRYVARVKCAMLAWVALEDALDHAPDA
ncbi:MAG TPA: SUF system NifU family Fe-S cluster assembly protein [Lacisediminihabitans sp.]|uniref:Fe-S cluster assembly sulfur transfer protein SufU n=1 Tax=Lacisediminihabitans sp. TaxID=2787631 RepID=UPI002EDB7009